MQPNEFDHESSPDELTSPAEPRPADASAAPSGRRRRRYRGRRRHKPAPGPAAPAASPGSPAEVNPEGSVSTESPASSGGETTPPLAVAAQPGAPGENSGSPRRRHRRRRHSRGFSSAPASESPHGTEPAQPAAGGENREAPAPEKEGASETAAVETPVPAPVFIPPRREPDFRQLKFPGIHPKAARENLLRVMQEYREHTGKDKAVVGLSGGLDSAVTAALAVEAFGRERTALLYCMEPERSAADKARAEMTARQLQTRLEVLDLRGLAQQPVAEARHTRRWTARLRTAMLMDRAEADSALLIGAFNKTKWLLGFGGAHAELAWDLNLLGDLYHSQVLELAATLPVHAGILEKARQHPLAAGASGSEAAELTWEETDLYLYQMVDLRLALVRMRDLGLEEKKIRWIYRQLRDSEPLRRTPPHAGSLSAYLPRSWKPSSGG